RPRSSHLVELLLAREEPLRQQRQRGRGSGGTEIVDRAREPLVDEHRDGGGTRRLEARGQLGRIGARPQVAGGRRAPLDFGDRRQARRGERVPKAAHYATTSACENATSPSRRSAAAPEPTASASQPRPSR